MEEFTYIKTMILKHNSQVMKLDMDSLEIFENNIDDKNFSISDIVCGETMINIKDNSVNKKYEQLNKKRILTLSCDKLILTITFTNNLATISRNNVSISIDSEFELNAINYSGAVICESESNNL